MKNMMYICAIFTFVFFFTNQTYAQTEWEILKPSRGNYTFALPEKPQVKDSVGVAFYYLRQDDIIFQVHFVDSMEINSNELSQPLLEENDVSLLRAQAQMMLLLTNGELVSIKDIDNGDRQGLDFGVKYFNGTDDDLYTFCRFYRWKNAFLSVTITSDVYHLDKLLEAKLKMFDSITFK